MPLRFSTSTFLAFVEFSKAKSSDATADPVFQSLIWIVYCGEWAGIGYLILNSRGCETPILLASKEKLFCYVSFREKSLSKKGS